MRLKQQSLSMKRRRTTCMALVAIPMLIASTIDRASAAVYYLSETYGIGSVAPAGKSPWLTLTATTLSGADAGKVQFEFYASGLTGPEYVDEWYLNIDPALDPKNLSFDSPVKTGSFSLPKINLATDGYKAGPDGRFDIKLLFSTSNAGGGINRFTAGDKLSYTVSYKGDPITAESFDFFSKPEGSYGPYHTAAHVLATGPDASGCAWVNSVPEPGPPLQALTLGTALLAFYRRRG
jgi:hypothetical protein